MDKALKTMIENMPEKTGKSLDLWKHLLASKSFAKHSEAVRFLKSEYNVTHGYASTIVLLSKESNESPDDLVENQYKGKEALWPIYEKLVGIIVDFGDDVKISPKKSTVSMVRKRQFALIKPATKSRIDLGLKLTGKPLTDRLESSGPFGTMCTHRVRLGSTDDVNPELVAWLQEAYEKAD